MVNKIWMEYIVNRKDNVSVDYYDYTATSRKVGISKNGIIKAFGTKYRGKIIVSSMKIRELIKSKGRVVYEHSGKSVGAIFPSEGSTFSIKFGVKAIAKISNLDITREFHDAALKTLDGVIRKRLYFSGIDT